MRSIIKNDFKIFFRSIYLPVIYLILLGFINTNFIMKLARVGNTTARDSLYLLTDNQHYGYFVFFVFLFLAFEYMQRAKASDIFETLEAASGGVAKMFLGKLTVLIVFDLFVALNAFAFDFFWYQHLQIDSLPYLSQIIQCEILDYFLVGLVAILAGALFAQVFRRIGGYLCIIALAFVILPFSNVYLSAISVGKFNFSFLKDITYIIAPNLDWLPDSLYGVPVEFYRWMLMLFWLSLLAFFIVQKLFRNRGIVIRAVSLSLAAVFIFSTIQIVDPACIIRKPDTAAPKYKKETAGYADFYYYFSEQPKIEKANFQVTQYDLNLTITNRLEAKAEIYVDKSISTYFFTLYHGYEVSSVTDGDGKPLSYIRGGDYLDISPGDYTGPMVVTYKGYNDTYYSNNQAVLLPGFFAYYPIPGHFAVYNTSGSFLPVIDYEDKIFHVALHAPLPLYTNLTQNDKGEYAGTTNALTIMGGLAAQQADGGLREVYLPAQSKAVVLDVDSVNKAISELCGRLGEDRVPQLPSSYTVFAGPQGLITSPPNIAAFHDHLISFSGFSVSAVACAYVMGNTDIPPEKQALAQILTEYLSNKENFMQLYTYNPKFSRMYRYDASNATRNQVEFSLAVQKSGEDTSVRAVYQYLIDNKSTQSIREFLNQLCGWNAEVDAYEASF